MLIKPLLRTWAVALVCCTIAAILVHAMMLPASGNALQQGIAYFLLPGVALFARLNGSIFYGFGGGGGGFGKVGDFLIIVLGSALAWSVAILFVVRGASWLWRLRRHRP